MSNNIPQLRVWWGDPAEVGAGSQGHCNTSDAPHLAVDIIIILIIIIIIIIINMGTNITCTTNCKYRKG
jgi:hypothetical protein